MKITQTYFNLIYGDSMTNEPKVGDIITVPLRLQLIKVAAHNDVIYHIGIPVANPKRLVYLDGPHFMVCTDPYPDEKIEPMDMKMLNNAVAFIHKRYDDEDIADG